MRHLLFLLVLFITLHPAHAQLTGAYTIACGASTGGTTFASFADAATALNTSGVSGPVTITVEDGTCGGVYGEQISLGSIAGASSINTVTFAEAVGASVTLALDPAEGSNYVVHLDGTDHVAFNGIDFDSDPSDDGGFGRVIHLEGVLDGITIQNATISGVSTIDGDNAFSLIFGQDFSQTTDLFIAGNTLTGGGAQLALVGDFSNRSAGTRIEDNTFLDTGNLAIFATQHDGIVILGNDFVEPAGIGIFIDNSFAGAHIEANTFEATNGSPTGFRVEDSVGPVHIVGNRIVTNGSGIQLSNVEGDVAPGGQGLVANNEIVIGGFGTTRGLDFLSTERVHVFHNSVRMASTSPGATALLVDGATTGGTLDIRNNIFANTGGRRAVVVTVDGVNLIGTSDYNDLFTTGATLASWGATSAADLAAFQSASSQEANSLSVNPGFASETDLQASSVELDDGGIAVDAIFSALGFPYVDFAGAPRSTEAPPEGPSIGAFEFEGFLPVELVAFQAFTEEARVHLSWQTASERGNAGFDVERSVDGQVFEAVGFVAGAGTTRSATHYTFTDEPPLGAGRLYYRLRQIDVDGAVTVGAPITVEAEPPAMFAVGAPYPNPFRHSATFHVALAAPADVVLEVYDVSGRRVAQHHLGWQPEGHHRFDLPGEALAAGMYVYRLQAGESVHHGRLVRL